MSRNRQKASTYTLTPLTPHFLEREKKEKKKSLHTTKSRHVRFFFSDVLEAQERLQGCKGVSARFPPTRGASDCDLPRWTPLNSMLTGRTLLWHAARCAGNQAGVPGSSGPRWSRQASSLFAGPRCAHASRQRSTPIDPPLFFLPIPRRCLVCVPAARTKAPARTPASLTRDRAVLRSALCCAANEAE